MGAFDGLRDGQIQHGHFGVHTSSIDWCELNYTHSRFIAEFVNTLTNVPTILLGLYGAWACHRGGIRKRYSLSFLGQTLIGIGSFGFHASLMWEWQLMDELPMIYVVSWAAYLVLDTQPTFTPRFGIIGPLILIAWCTFVTLSYLYLPNPIYHQVAFGFIMLSSITRNAQLITRLPKGSAARNKIQRTLLLGVAMFILGFAAWNVDNIFCNQLRAARKHMGPFGFLLQGHGYWHLLTTYGTFLIFTSCGLLQLITKTSPAAYDFDETAWFPTVYAVPPPTVSITPPVDIKDEKAVKGEGAASAEITDAGAKAAGSASGQQPKGTEQTDKAKVSRR